MSRLQVTKHDMYFELERAAYSVFEEEGSKLTQIRILSLNLSDLQNVQGELICQFTIYF